MEQEFIDSCSIFCIFCYNHLRVSIIQDKISAALYRLIKWKISGGKK